MDIYPTALALAGTKLPEKITFDGRDLSPLLFQQKKLPEQPFFYYRGDQLFACRLGEWKAHFQTQPGYAGTKAEQHDAPQLFHLGTDPSEKRNVANQHADIIAAIQAAVEKHQSDLVPGAPQLR
jgi:arylsulfatase A-like enzyme